MSAVQYDRNLITFFDICCSGYDLNFFTLFIYLYLTNHKLIRIRMFFDLIDLANNDLVEILIKLCESLYLCS